MFAGCVTSKVGRAGQPTATTPLSACGNYQTTHFGGGPSAEESASLLGIPIHGGSGRFDWFTRLVNLQALRPSRDAGTVNFATSLTRGEGSDRLRSWAQRSAEADITSIGRAGSPTYRPYVAYEHTGSSTLVFQRNLWLRSWRLGDVVTSVASERRPSEPTAAGV